MPQSVNLALSPQALEGPEQHAKLCKYKPAADVIEEERDGVKVQLDVVIEAAVPLQLHCLPQQGLQPPWGQHHRWWQVGYKIR